MTITRYILVNERGQAQYDSLYFLDQAIAVCNQRYAIVRVDLDVDLEDDGTRLEVTPCGCSEWPCHEHCPPYSEGSWPGQPPRLKKLGRAR